MRHPRLPIERRVGVAGCKHTTLELIRGLLQGGFRVDHCVTISPEKGEEQRVAGYLDLRPHLDELGIPWTLAAKYNLRSEEDRERMLALGLDLLLVNGWQRLIPDWWLDALPIGAYGMHGSSRPLPHGRGRSPLNWSLIQGKEVFYTHLFQYLPGVDDGPVVAVQLFDITPFDTALTLHYKNTLSMVRLCIDHLPSLLDGTARKMPQPAEGATYYPKRGAEDGLLYFEDDAATLYNLVRAVTRPFPGAFAYLDDDRDRPVTIWRAVPFDSRLTWPAARPGEIVAVFHDGGLVVRTGGTAGCTSLLVQESEGHAFTPADVGRRLGTAGTPRKVWEDLPE